MRWYRIPVVVVVGTLLGLAWNTWSGRGLALTANAYLKPGEETIDVVEAKRRFDRHAVLFLDARPKMVYDLQRIPGALSLPEDEFDAYFKDLEPRLRGRYDVAVYCSGFGCEASHIVARKLKEKGIPAIVLLEGLPAWQEAGYPVEEGPRR